MDRRNAITLGAAAGMGGLLPARPDQQYYPPRSAGPVAGARAGILRAREVIIFGSGKNSGVFAYSPKPAFGNLIASITSAAGTDPYGNSYVQGVASYFQGTPAFALGFTGISLQWYNAASPAGPFGANGPNLAVDGTGKLLNIAPGSLGSTNIVLGLFNALAGASVTGGLTADTAAITAGGNVAGGLTWSGDANGDRLTLTRAGGAPLLEVDNTLNASTPSIRIKTLLNAVQQLAIGVLATTDTNSRILLGLDPNGNGRLNAGSGAAAPDVALFRTAPNLWASDYLAFGTGGVAETWNAPTFANGWVNAATGAALQYKRVAAPENAIELVGRITVPVGFATPSNIITALPAAYRPANVQDILAVDITTFNLVRLQLGTGGVLSYQAGANAAGDTIAIPAGSLASLTA